MRKQLRAKGVMLTLAVALAVGAPVSMLQNPVEASAKAVAKKGLKKENGKFYFYEKGKKVKNKWVIVGKKKYYFKKDGSAAIGWNKIGNKAYYFDDKAVMVKNKTVHKVKLDKKGEAKLNDRAKVMIKAQSVVDKKTQATQTKEQKLKACYNYMLRCRFEQPWDLNKKIDPKKTAGWEVPYANDMLQSKKGNCYSFASTFAMLAKVCGYDAKIVMGTMSVNGKKDGEHAWVEINGKVYDPQQQLSFKTIFHKNVDFYSKVYNGISQVKYTVKKKV